MIRTPLGSKWVPDALERYYNEGLAVLHDLEQAHRQAMRLVADCYEAQSRCSAAFDESDETRHDPFEKYAAGKTEEVEEWLHSTKICIFDGSLKKNLAELRRLLDEDEFGIAAKHVDETDGASPKYKGIEMERASGGRGSHLRPTDQGMQEVNDRLEHAEQAMGWLADPYSLIRMKELLDEFERHIARLRDAHTLFEDITADILRSSEE